MEKLTDICDIQYGYAFDSTCFTEDSSYPPLVRIRDVKRGFSETYYSGEYPEEYVLHAGDLLVGMDGEFNIARWKSIDALLNQRVCKLTAKVGTNEEYLRFAMVKALKTIEDKTAFVTVKHLSAKALNKLELDIPCIEEQNLRADSLSKLEKIISLREDELRQLDDLIKARFVELFGLPVSNTKGWKTEQMGEVAPAVNYKGEFDDEVWLLNLDMVEAQTGRILDYLVVSEEEVGNSTCTFDTSNVLYSKLRPYLNKVVIPDRCGYATSELVPLQPVKTKINREYFAFMLRSDEFVNMINEKVAGAKMPRVPMGDFRKFDVPVPPMELQEQFADLVHQVDKSKVAVQKALDETQILFDSLMQEYFG